VKREDCGLCVFGLRDVWPADDTDDTDGMMG
jgi:hypothetical protein